MNFSICIRAGVLAVVVSNAAWISTAFAQNEVSDSQHLAAIVNKSLERNADILAAQSALKAAHARLQGTAQPLNNPELEGEAERTDINTFKFGISQTIDWHDKRSAFEQVALTELEVSRQELATLRLEKADQLLDAMGRIAIQQQITNLSQRRMEILSRFSKLAAQRHAAGDIPRAELELARLSLAEASMDNARHNAKLIIANNDFFALGGQQGANDIRLPAPLSVPKLSSQDIDSLVQKHPQVQTALLRSQVAKRQINAVDRERKADPTIGITAGREDNNNLLALRFSIPLQVRNNYQSNVEAANAIALEAEQKAQQAFRTLHARLKSAQQRYEIVSSAWKHWQKLGNRSLQQRTQLLGTLWKAGEISTSDYLFQIQQTLNTQISGIELQGDLWRTWLDWMSASASLPRWLEEKNRG